MSELHDRVAERDTRCCAAYGCPAPGTMRPHTNGGDDWYCWLHYGQNPGKLQGITAAMNRERWLVETIVKLRRDYGGREYNQTFAEAANLLQDRQRADLLWMQGETEVQWFLRLDGALAKLVNPPPTQTSLIQQLAKQPGETWNKLEFDPGEQNE